MRIVIVDDKANDLGLLRQILQREGHTTFEASDGLEALNIIRHETVDVLMTDVEMPRMDGFRLCHEIRADALLFNLPIIVYTATYTSESAEKLALRIGADRFLKKPAPIGMILSTLNEAITVKHSAPSNGTIDEIEVLKGYNDQIVLKLEKRTVDVKRGLSLAALSVDVGLALIHEATLRHALQCCSDAFVRHLGLALVRIWTYDSRTNLLELEASAGMYTLQNEIPDGAPAGRLSIDPVLEERRSLAISFVTGDPRFPEQAWARREGLIAFAGYPMIIGDVMYGVLAIFDRSPIDGTILDKTAMVADALALGIERKRIGEALRTAGGENVALQQEVHHRVNNNLQVISSLLAMQIAREQNGGLYSQPLNDAYSRILALSLIHQQIQQSGTVSDFNFGEYIEQLSGNLFDSRCGDRSRIQLELSVEAIRLDLNQSIPCGLILNELLTNSLRHAFCDGRTGSVRICVRKTETGLVELSVADTGVGLPPGFELEGCKTLGLEVVQILAKQLRAELRFLGEHGTTFILSWKPAGPDGVQGSARE